MCSQSEDGSSCSLELLSTAELVELALEVEDENKAWKAVSVLHYRGTEEALLAAKALCYSEDPHVRKVGVDILGQIGVPERSFPEECVTTLLDLIQREEHAEVLYSIGVALGHHRDVRAVAPLVPLKTHLHPKVRYGVVFGLMCHEDPLAIVTLIELMEDVDDEVRDWATFAIGSQIEVDTPQIREALFRRVEDPDPDARGEALKGLANRGDERVVEPLIRELLSDTEVLGMALDAAESLGDPRLYPALLTMRRQWEGDPEYIDAALERCKRGGRPVA
jgi:HEAT repeat protein